MKNAAGHRVRALDLVVDLGATMRKVVVRTGVMAFTPPFGRVEALQDEMCASIVSSYSFNTPIASKGERLS